MQSIFYALLEKCEHKVQFLIMLEAGEKKTWIRFSTFSISTSVQ